MTNSVLYLHDRTSVFNVLLDAFRIIKTAVAPESTILLLHWKLVTVTGLDKPVKIRQSHFLTYHKFTIVYM